MVVERLDIFTEDFKWVGQATRHEVHQKGYWHQTFHCWVVHKTDKGAHLLLQRRHATKDTHPLKLDTSCAGHLVAGEGPEDGVRELQEELGLHTNFKALHKVGLFKYNGEDVIKKVVDHEFCHIYAYVRKAESLEEYQPALGEVSGLYLIPLEKMKLFCRGITQSVDIQGYEVNDNGDKTEQSLRINQDDLVKNELSYYELLFRYLENLGIH
jgi:isopentenyldiphosphate isomerase